MALGPSTLPGFSVIRFIPPHLLIPFPPQTQPNKIKITTTLLLCNRTSQERERKETEKEERESSSTLQVLITTTPMDDESRKRRIPRLNRFSLACALLASTNSILLGYGNQINPILQFVRRFHFWVLISVHSSIGP